MTNDIEIIKKGIFAELKIWDDLTIGDCDETYLLLNYYNLWEFVCKHGWQKEYEAFANA